MQEISTARPSLQTPKLSLAKMAGLLYLVIISTWLWSELFARGPLVTADALETAENSPRKCKSFASA